MKELRTESVHDPSVRKGDPYAWRCLSNEDRDVIYEWFQDYKERDTNDSKHQKEMFDKSTLFAFVPFAVIYGYQAANYESWSLQFLWNTIAAYVCFLAFFSLCREIGEYVIERFSPIRKKSDVWFRVFEVCVAVVVTIFATIFILHAIYH